MAILIRMRTITIELKVDDRDGMPDNDRLCDVLGTLGSDIIREVGNIAKPVCMRINDVMVWSRFIPLPAPFKNIDLSDTFFDSLREDYPGFNEWFERKRDATAYVVFDASNKLAGFLHTKVEDETEDYSDIGDLPPKRRLKICTFKVSESGCGIGSMFMRIVDSEAKRNKVDETYFTLYTRTQGQIDLCRFMERHGFLYYGYRKNEEYVFQRKENPDGKGKMVDDPPAAVHIGDDARGSGLRGTVQGEPAAP